MGRPHLREERNYMEKMLRIKDYPDSFFFYFSPIFFVSNFAHFKTFKILSAGRFAPIVYFGSNIISDLFYDFFALSQFKSFLKIYLVVVSLNCLVNNQMKLKRRQVCPNRQLLLVFSPRIRVIKISELKGAPNWAKSSTKRSTKIFSQKEPYFC